MTTAKPRILFVDDEKAVLSGIRRGLSAKADAWEMIFYSNPKDAFEAARNDGFDVIVTDLRMPELSGLDLLKALRKEGVATQAIILTGSGDMQSAMQAINDVSAFRYYTKPCPLAELAKGIDEALAEARAAAAQTPFAQSALDALPVAALAIDAQGKLLFANRAGNDLLALRDPVFLDGMGHCRAKLQNGGDRLNDALDQMAVEEIAQVHALAARNGTRFSLLIEPPPEAAGDVAAILFLRPIDGQEPPSADQLKQLFGFSPAEARLARELAKGLDLKEAAEALGVTVNTARTYLRVVFQKAGVNRQSELIRLIGAALAGG